MTGDVDWLLTEGEAARRRRVWVSCRAASGVSREGVGGADEDGWRTRRGWHDDDDGGVDVAARVWERDVALGFWSGGCRVWQDGRTTGEVSTRSVCAGQGRLSTAEAGVGGETRYGRA